MQNMSQEQVDRVIDLLNEQRSTIARMDERSKAEVEARKRMEEDIRELKEDMKTTRSELQEVRDTAFRNAVIVGFVGAGVGASLGCVLTLLGGKYFA